MLTARRPQCISLFCWAPHAHRTVPAVHSPVLLGALRKPFLQNQKISALFWNLFDAFRYRKNPY